MDGVDIVQNAFHTALATNMGHVISRGADTIVVFVADC